MPDKEFHQRRRKAVLGTKENPQTGKSQKEQQAQVTTEVTTASQGKPAQSTITDGRQAARVATRANTRDPPADGEEQRGETSVGR